MLQSSVKISHWRNCWLILPRFSVLTKNYVSTALDCFNGEIVALEMCDNMKKKLCMDTVKQLREKYGRFDETVLHSNCGCQYTSYAFRKEPVTNGLIQSLMVMITAMTMPVWRAPLPPWKRKAVSDPDLQNKTWRGQNCHFQIHLRLLQHPEDQQLQHRRVPICGTENFNKVGS